MSGWRPIPLGDLLDVQNGYAFSSEQFSDQEGMPLVRIRDLKPNTSPPIRFSGAFDARYVVNDGDLLIGMDGEFACYEWGGGQALLNQRVCRLVDFSDGVEPRFLLYGINKFLKEIENGTAYTTVKHLSSKTIKEIRFPLPPLDEQKRIVALLDQAFAALDRVHANIEANVVDADEAYKFAVASVLDLEDIEHIEVGLSEISKIRAGGGFPEADQGALEGAYPFYKVSDMNLPGNAEYLSTANNYISKEVQERLGAFVFPAGTIVFPKVGGAIATNKKRVLTVESCVDNNVMGLIPDINKISPDYLHELMRSIDIYEFSNKANPPSITQATVSRWPVRVPSRKHQNRVVDQLRKLRSGVEALKERYSAQVADAVTLRQSILQAAFSGQLT